GAFHPLLCIGGGDAPWATRRGLGDRGLRTRVPTLNIHLALPLTQPFRLTLANTNQNKDDHCKEKPATDPDQPPLLSFRNSSRTRSRGWDPTSPVRSGGSGKVSATLGLLATSGIWEIASRSDLGAQRRWFASAPIRLRGSVVPAVKLWRVAIDVSFHPLASVSSLGFSGLQGLVADCWVRSGYRSPIVVCGLVIFLVCSTFTVLSEWVPDYGCFFPLLPPEVTISPPEHGDANLFLGIFRPRLWPLDFSIAAVGRGGWVLTWLCLSVSSPFFTAFLMMEEINFTLSDGATGGVFDFEEFLRCDVCLSQIPKNSISVLRLSRVALEIGGRSGILRNGAAPLAAVAFADDCGLTVEKIRALSRPSL
ncbi:hypothetical protein U1Q18_007801, partial [Sarracenia purpurea var. burkii]